MALKKQTWVQTWISPNGVEHTIVRGRCITCGRVHESEPGPKFVKGDKIIVPYRSVFHSGGSIKKVPGTVIRQKKNGIVTVNVWDEEEGADAWVDAYPQELTRR
jgi:hypothetical protein